MKFAMVLPGLYSFVHNLACSNWSFGDGLLDVSKGLVRTYSLAVFSVGCLLGGVNMLYPPTVV